MRALPFFSKLLLSVLFLPTVLSAVLTILDNEEERNDIPNQCHLNMSASHHKSDSSKHGSKKNKDGAIFASYRNSVDITIPAGGHVLFNVENSNKGDGIQYENGVFTILKSGFYLINYGLSSIGNAGSPEEAFGFNLIRTRNSLQSIVDSVLANSSSAIILFLNENDKIAIDSQEFEVTLTAGHLPPRTTSLTDTAHISFLRVDQ